jgi:PAS domain S-box-containing protein
MNKTRILIAEDEGVVAHDLQLQLEELGYELVADTVSGEQAIQLAGELRPDLVLMDVHLAGAVDGVAAALAIREQFALPVVFLTAFAGDTTLERAKVAEPFGYLIKPIDERELRAVIEMALYKHQAERQLRQSYEEQAAILRTALDGFWIVDAQGRILNVNDAACRMSGYAREELLRMTIADLDADDSPAEVAAKMAVIIQAGGACFERRHRCKDGHLIEVEVSVNYLPGNGGRHFAFLRDITGRKLAEAAVQESELRFRTLLQSCLSVAVQGYGPDGTTHYWNVGSERLYGYTASEAIGQNLLDLIIPPEMRAEVAQAVPQMLAAGQPLPPGELTLRRKDGSPVTVFSSHVVVQVPGRATELFCIDIDLTDRRRAEQAVRESQVDLCRAQAVAHIGSWKSDLQRHEIEWSDETYRIFEIPVGTRVTPEVFFACVHPQDLGLVDALGPQARPGEFFEFRIVVGGRVKWVRERAELQFDPDGVPRGVFGTVQDITERRRAEEAVAEAERFATATIDALSAHLCVLDETGTILATNHAWDSFAATNPPPSQKVCAGTNYLEICTAVSGPEVPDATAFAAGLRAVLSGKREEFALEYPCHAPTEQRWFVGRVTRFAGPGPVRVVVTHENITERKLAELKLAERLSELKRWEAVMLGREGRNMELKREVNDLLRRLGEPIRYQSQA